MSHRTDSHEGYKTEFTEKSVSKSKKITFVIEQTKSKKISASCIYASIEMYEEFFFLSQPRKF